MSKELENRTGEFAAWFIAGFGLGAAAYEVNRRRIARGGRPLGEELKFAWYSAAGERITKYLQVEYRGLENWDMLEKGKPVVVYGNHQSNVDPVLAFRALPRELQEQAQVLGKASYWGRPLFRPFTTLLPVMLVDTGYPNKKSFRKGLRRDLDTAVEWLSKGRVIVVFPEGTRRRKEEIELGSFANGAGHLVRRTGAQVVPVRIGEQIWRVYGPGKLLPSDREPIPVTIGEPMSFQQKLWEHDREFEQRVTMEMKAAMLALPAR